MLPSTQKKLKPKQAAAVVRLLPSSWISMIFGLMYPMDMICSSRVMTVDIPGVINADLLMNTIYRSRPMVAADVKCPIRDEFADSDDSKGITK